ncbi:hypothetical protein [Rubinisphaera brasiliensis]|uniref:Transmembrane protein n=1 Tax=Rubinisphaera brasiliensis (strain ATCC 49424 / DSM 5305 / JCM 21570 / IAM 15109 / NBRC 103401 / IFAM 1448) TaxID=756272 RepID=F0SG99_RUBBR|nr:hypothetical protein [Rubinisphaera brasiliensis]ADY59441.1 hypothetical protein Plabr_1831 [Rubinisphaera brasiliensis DSM 5305]
MLKMKEWQWWLGWAVSTAVAIVVACYAGLRYSTDTREDIRFRHYEAIIEHLNKQGELPFPIRYRSTAEGPLFVETEGLTKVEADLQKFFLTEALTDLAYAEIAGEAGDTSRVVYRLQQEGKSQE